MAPSYGAQFFWKTRPLTPCTVGPPVNRRQTGSWKAINKQDAIALQKMVAPDCVYLDEDGHAPPVARWITQLTSGTHAKTISISSTHSQMWNDTGWVSFNYTLNETFKDQPGRSFGERASTLTSFLRPVERL